MLLTAQCRLLEVERTLPLAAVTAASDPKRTCAEVHTQAISGRDSGYPDYSQNRVGGVLEHLTGLALGHALAFGPSGFPAAIYQPTLVWLSLLVDRLHGDTRALMWLLIQYAPALILQKKESTAQCRNCQKATTRRTA